MSASSLCFKEAHEARLSGSIDLEEFLRHIVAHYGGLRHQTDEEGARPYIPGWSFFEDAVREIVLRDTFQPLDNDGVAIIYSIFLGAFQGNATTIRNLINSFSISSQYYRRPLLEISKAEGDSQLLRICFENGFFSAGYGDMDLDSVDLLSSRIGNNPSTEWLDVLFDFDFHQWRTNSESLCKQRTWIPLFFMGADCMRWWVEHGGRAPRARGLFWSYNHQKWPGAGPIRVLLDQFGVDWFNDSGTLQLAVKNHDLESVRMLVEAGADVNELPTEWEGDIREGRAAPVEALNHAIYAKSEEMIRYLVEHGAKLTLKDLAIPDPYNTLRKEFWPFRDLVVELGAVKEETSL